MNTRRQETSTWWEATVPHSGVSQNTSIGNAYAVLSNPEKRRQYEQCGDVAAADNAPQQTTGHPHHSYHRNFTKDFEADISPEELFNTFFGGKFPKGNIHMYSNRGATYSHMYQQRKRRPNERRGAEAEEDQSQVGGVFISSAGGCSQSSFHSSVHLLQFLL
ncbi:hypothetical protein GN956_G1043 [Arapaima gigas]